MDRLFAEKVNPRHFQREVARIRLIDSGRIKDESGGDVKGPIATAIETERATSGSV
jgi:hypothetical protein